ncbi:multiheme c-type cytochrome [Sulfurimonas sp. HSL-1716]|uniref:multiheme c-type cytochrome n=1 Tax=Hydrocurvibacter sulfurireducens TaxID=3131937 RepID=UPI0031F96D4B
MKIYIVKISIILMFITGILQLDQLHIKWEFFTLTQAVHILGSIFVTIFFLIPLIKRHVYYYAVIEKVDYRDGALLGGALLLILISGTYLFLVGNRGGDILGSASFYVHLYGSFVLLGMLFYHMRKHVKDLKVQISLLILLISVAYPASSYAEEKLSKIKLGDHVQRYHSEDWTNSVKCKSCHSEIFNEWADSNHKHIAGSNPYYMVMETLAGEDQGQGFRKWCMGCHNPSALTTEHEKTTHGMQGNFLSNDIFEKNAQASKEDFADQDNFRLEEGVSCIACHRIEDVNSTGNASYTLDLTDRKKYMLEESRSDIGRWVGQKFINSKPGVHKSSYSNDVYKQSKFCASCHDEFHPVTGFKIVSTYEQWKKSPYNDPKDKTKNKTCIDCHMTNLKDGKFSPLRGASTDGGEIKSDIKVHYFAGSNHFLVGLKNKAHEEQTLQLLRTSAKLDVDIKDGKILVGVKNVGAGHNLPTGVADFRELWLDVTVQDKNNKTVFSSGKLTKDGSIEKGSRVFMKVFGDKNDKPVGLMFWKAAKLLSDTTIPAKERRIETYEVGTKLQYPLKVTVKLNFRIYPQWVSNAVQRIYPQLPSPPVVEVKKVEKEFADE